MERRCHPSGAIIFLLICMLTLLGFSSAQHDEGIISSEFSPRQPLAASGSMMLVNCTLRGLPQGVTAHMLRCTFDDHVLPTTVLSDSVAEIKLESVTRQMTGGHIFCHLNNSGTILPIGHLVIRVADIPIAPDVTECVVYNWQRMICKWEPATQDTGLPINQTLIWSVIRDLNPDNICRRRRPLQNNTCEWITNDKQDSFRMDMTYYLNVHVSSEVGSVMSRVFPIHTSDLVKPDPVINLITKDVTSRSMTLVWIRSYEEGGGTEKVVRYRITYHSQWDSTTSMMNATESENFELTDLIPFTNYTIFVDSIPLIDGKERGFWSDKVKVIQKTNADVPGQAPAITTGGFFRGNKIGDDRKVEIFWKPVPERYIYGITVQKPIRVRCSDVSKRDEVLQTLYFDSVASESIQLSSDKNYAIQIDIANNIGFNEDLLPEALIIPSTKYGLKTAENVIATANRSEITVHWFSVVNATGYTVYWCEGAIHAAKLCKTPLNWTSVFWNVTDVTIAIDNSRRYAEYLVAVSMETYLPALNQIVSGGMKWAECIQDVKNKLKPPTKLELSKSQNSFSLTLEWMPPNCVDTAYITGYELIYCQKRTCSENVCCFENKTLNITDKTLDHYVIENLLPDVEYEVRVRSLSQIGVSEFTEPVQYVVFGSGLTRAAIVGIVVGSIFLIILLTIGLLTILKKAKKYFDCCGEIKIVPPISRIVGNPNELYPRAEYTNYLPGQATSDDNTEQDRLLLKSEGVGMQLRNHCHHATESPWQPLVNGEGDFALATRYIDDPTTEVSSFLPPHHLGDPANVPRAPGGDIPHSGDPSISAYAHLGILENERSEETSEDAVERTGGTAKHLLPAAAVSAIETGGRDTLSQMTNHSGTSIAPYTTIGMMLPTEYDREGVVTTGVRNQSTGAKGNETSVLKEEAGASIRGNDKTLSDVSANHLPLNSSPENINVESCSHDNDDVRFSDSSAPSLPVGYVSMATSLPA